MKKSIIAVLVIVMLVFVAGCSSANPTEKAFKEGLKKAEEIKKLSLAEKFDKFTNETTLLESRALLGAPQNTITGKMGDTEVTIYIWKDKDSKEVGAAFAGAKLVQKLDSEQIEFFKSNSKKE